MKIRFEVKKRRTRVTVSSGRVGRHEEGGNGGEDGGGVEEDGADGEGMSMRNGVGVSEKRRRWGRAG